MKAAGGLDRIFDFTAFPVYLAMSFENIVIRASAGSGKTYQLSNRYLLLAAGGIEPETIFASTFTRKAAGEILYRILVRLAGAAADPGKLAELGESLKNGATEKDAHTLSREAVLDLLANLIRRLHLLRIGTLDSFFVKIAQAFSFELELPTGWMIADELNRHRFLEEAVRRVVGDMRAGDLVHLMQMLTKGEVARSVRAQLLSLAENLIEIHRDSEPAAWTALKRRPLLSERELADILERYEKAPLPNDKRAGAPHRKGYDNIVAGDWKTFLAHGFGKSVAEKKYTYYKARLDGELIDILEPLVRHAVAVQINDLVNQTEATGEILARIGEAYEEVKHAQRSLLFGDVTYRLANPRRLISESSLIHRIDARTRHLLLDEFQDTAPSQWEVLRMFVDSALYGTTTSGTTEPGSFFCVGDVKQAIYTWRGGDSTIFSAVENDVRPLRDDMLQTSWRSAPAIIDLVNLFFGTIDKNDWLIDPSKSTADEKAARNWRSGFEFHATAPRNALLGGYCVMETTPLAGTPEADDLFQSGPAGLSEEAFDCDAPDDVADYGSEEGGFGDSDGSGNGIERQQKIVSLAYAVRRIVALHHRDPSRSIGVLTRKNETIARLIYGLRKAGIDASEEGGNPLTDSAAVELVLSAMQLADHPGDTVARFHLANSRLAAVLGLSENAGDFSGSPGPASVPETVDCGRAARAAWLIRERLLSEGFGKTVRAWAKILAGDCDERELSRLLQLVEEAYLFDARKDRGLRCDRFIDLVRTKGVGNPNSAKVRVLTIHQSKGLEFDIVVLPELEGQLVGQPPLLVCERPRPKARIGKVVRYVGESLRNHLPDEYQSLFAEDRRIRIEESLCLLYVAMTRAKRELVMLVPGRKLSQNMSQNTAQKTSQKTPRPRKTFEGILRRGLLSPETRDIPNAVLFAHGNPDWYKTDGIVSQKRCPTVSAVPETLEVALAPLPERPRRLLRRFSPSAHSAQHEFEDAPDADDHGETAWDTRTERLEVTDETGDSGDSGRSFGKGDEILPKRFSHREREQAMLYGTAIHACFEQIEWIDDRIPEKEAIEEIVRRIYQAELPPRIAQTETESTVRDFYEMCAAPSIREALSRKERDRTQFRVFHERAFLIPRTEGTRYGLVRGSIDRLVVSYEGERPVGAEIIDFKTDRLDGGDSRAVRSRAKRYRPQLEAYREAVMRLYRLEKSRVKATLLFLDAMKTVTDP